MSWLTVTMQEVQLLADRRAAASLVLRGETVALSSVEHGARQRA